MNSRFFQIFSRNIGLISAVIMSGALTPRFTDDDLLNRSGLSSRALSAAGLAYASDAKNEENLSTKYDPIHELQSGLRDSDEITNEISKIAGPALPFQWNSDHWLKNKIAIGSLKLTSVLSHYQNVENRFEVMFIHNLPSESQHESQVTFFTDRINEADERTISSAILIPNKIEIKQGRPQFSDIDLGRYNFHLASSEAQRSFGLRDPEGAYDFALTTNPKAEINPLSTLNQADGPFDEVGNYQYDQKVGDLNYEVFINPRWQTENHQLTIEVQLHEVDSHIMKTFVLVYQLTSK